MFIWAIIFFVIAVFAFLVGYAARSARKENQVKVDAWNSENAGRIREGFVKEKKNDTPRGLLFFGIGTLLTLVGGVFLIFSMVFNVDNGSAAVLKDWSGVVNEDPVTEPGFHTKAPWEDAIIWDIRNQDVQFKGDQLIFIDKDGISAPMELQVLFSIRADSIVELTKSYSSQEDFKTKVINNDAQSVPLDIASTFTTVQVFEERTRLKTEIQELFKDTWEDKGIIVSNVNIHGTPYPDDVQQRFKDAQNAQTELQKAETEAQTAKTKAQGEADAEIARATGEAEANKLLSESLTPQVLQQRWIDALKSSNTIIVPQDFSSLGTLPTPPAG